MFVVVDVVVGFMVVADSVVPVVVVTVATVVMVMVDIVVDAVVVFVVVVVVIADVVVVVVVVFARFSLGDWFGLARSTLGGRFGVDEMKVGPSKKNIYSRCCFASLKTSTPPLLFCQLKDEYSAAAVLPA